MKNKNIISIDAPDEHNLHGGYVNLSAHHNVYYYAETIGIVK